MRALLRAHVGHDRVDVVDRRAHLVVHLVGDDQLADGALPSLNICQQFVAFRQKRIEIVVGLLVGKQFA